MQSMCGKIVYRKNIVFFPYGIRKNEEQMLLR